MPSSDYFQIPTVMQAVTQLKPASVLDIGIGFGKWGALCREYLDADFGRVAKPQWQTRIDGVEIFEPYRNPLWDAVYDRIWVGDAMDVLRQAGRYDLVIACDVIEHFTKNKVLVSPPIPLFDKHIRVSLGTPAEIREFWRVWDLMPIHQMSM